MALFEARGLHKRFGDRVVLEEIDLAFEAGTLTGIMGPNGAGKTTCFNCLTGLYAPDRGEIRFDDVNIAGLPPPAITRLGVARSFQAINLFNDDSALDNLVVALPGMRARSFDAWRDRARDRDAYDRAAAVLERVGLRGRERIRARDLAYGERRALEIGLALATEPRILFLDEPTSGLGANGTARLQELVAELKRQVTLVIIEHDMRFLFGLADRINVIHWGQVIARGTPEELRDNPWVQRSALGAVAC
jgi:branched-chain amino acid transport system ATP-binding protein